MRFSSKEINAKAAKELGLDLTKRVVKKALKEQMNTKYGFPERMQVFSYGNSKLPKTTLIVNQESATDCSSQEFCAIRKICYALKAERQYKQVRNRNQMVQEFFKKNNAFGVAELLLTYILLSPDNNKVDTIRLNESGDFPSQRWVNFWSAVSEHLEEHYGIKTYAYTARKDLDFTFARFTVNASRDDIDGANRYFRALDKERFDGLPKSASKCVGDCKICRKCVSKVGNSVIYVKKH